MYMAVGATVGKDAMVGADQSERQWLRRSAQSILIAMGAG